MLRLLILCLVLSSVNSARAADESKTTRPRSLATAITAFNQAALESPIGKTQPPITEEETLDAIASFVKLDHVAPPAKVILREIAAAKHVPANVEFHRYTRFDDEQQMHGVWWVRLVVKEIHPVFSVPVRTTQIYTRPYTQPERQQNTHGVTLINRFSSYYESPPALGEAHALPQPAADSLIAVAERAIAAKDVADLKQLYHWQDASQPTRDFVDSELKMLVQSTIHSVKITIIVTCFSI